MCIYLHNTPSTRTPTPKNVSYTYFATHYRIQWEPFLTCKSSELTTESLTLIFYSKRGKLHLVVGVLWARVRRVDVSGIIKEQLGVPSKCFRFYTNSQFVLDYLTLPIDSTFMYQTEWIVHCIYLYTPVPITKSMGTFSKSKKNQADQVTRSGSALQLANSMWLTGPSCDNLTRTLPELQ